MVLVLILIVSSTILLSGCQNGNSNETSHDSDKITEPSNDVAYEAEALDALAEYFENSGSPLWTVMQTLKNGAKTGYSVDITETENAIDSKDFVTHSVISSDPDVGTKMSVSAAYEDKEPVEFEVFMGKEDFVFSNNELFGDSVFGFKYGDIYENITDTVYDPDGTFPMRFTSYGLDYYVHPKIAQIEENNIAEQYNVYSQISNAFFKNAAAKKQYDEILVKDTSVSGDVISFELTGDDYKNFYHDLAEICANNNAVRNYVVNTCEDNTNTEINHFLYDNVAVYGYEDYISYLRQKGDSGKKNGASVSLRFCLDGDELVGVSFENAEKKYPCKYSFAKTQDGNVAYCIFTTDKDPNHSGLTFEEFGIASFSNTKDKYSVKYSYNMLGVWKDTEYYKAENKEGSFEWDKNSGEYALCYLIRGMDQKREGKLFVKDSGFELESYCRKYGNMSFVQNSEGKYEYVHTSALTALNDARIVFTLGKQSVDMPEYTNTMCLSEEDAKLFIEETVDNFIKSFDDDSWANFCACSNEDLMFSYGLDSISDATEDLAKLNICTKLVYDEVFNCIASYKHIGQEDGLKMIMESCHIIENGTYYCLDDGINLIYEYKTEDKENLKNQKYYLITFEDYKATVEYVGH